MKAKFPSDWLSSQRGFLVLIELLVVIVIIGILFVALYGTGAGGGAGGKGSDNTGATGGGTPLGASVRMARGTVCKNNMAQLRMAIGIFANTNERNPNSLEEVNAGVPLTCPVGGEPYQYDPNTGQVHCVHPGHEGY